MIDRRVGLSLSRWERVWWRFLFCGDEELGRMIGGNYTAVARMDVNVHATHTKPTGSRLVRLSGLCRNSPMVYRRAGWWVKLFMRGSWWKRTFRCVGLGPHHFDRLSAAPGCDDWSACRVVPLPRGEGIVLIPFLWWWEVGLHDCEKTFAAIKVARQVASLVLAFVLLSGERVRICGATIWFALFQITALTFVLLSFVIRVSKRQRVCSWFSLDV